MNFGAILEIIVGVLKFPEAVLAIVRLFERTPAEKAHVVLAEVLAAFAKADAVDPATGRPSDDVTDIENGING